MNEKIMEKLSSCKINKIKINGVEFVVRDPRFGDLFKKRNWLGRILTGGESFEQRSIDEVLSLVIESPEGITPKDINEMDTSVVEKLVENIPKMRKLFSKKKELEPVLNESPDYFG